MKSISLKFFPNKRATIDSRSKIYGRLIIDRVKIEFSTSFRINVDDWDYQKNSPKKGIAIKQELIEIENKIYRIIRKFDDDGKEYTPRDVIDVLKNRGQKFQQVKLVDYYEKYFKELQQKGESSDSTLKHYSGTLKILKSFLQEKNLLSIKMNKIDYVFINKFDYYLTVDYVSPYKKKISKNTRNKHHARLRAVLNSAIKEDLLQKNPYAKMSLKNDKVKREFLSQEEIELLVEIDLSHNESLSKARDIFLFSCFTGLRFEDAQNLSMDDLKETNKGEKFIEIKMGKTNEIVLIPLMQKALSIIEKYTNYNDRLISNKVLPSLSNQKFNVYIKVIADLAGVDKKIYHHLSRHTFATQALNNGIPIEIVQKLLGHTSIRTTQIYAKLLDQTIFNEMKKMENII
jgi:integrase/recombinase XerD